MSFRWTVDPYMFRNEMRTAYTAALLRTGSRIGPEQAKQIETWMKENAVWRDLQPDASPSRKARSRHARKNLYARVIPNDTSEARDILRAEQTRAMQFNQRSLERLNKQRSAMGKSQLQRLPTAMRVPVPQAQKIPIIRIQMGHGTSVANTYGLWLEVGFGGRYSIIAPAVSYWGAKTMNTVQRIINLGYDVPRGGVISNEPGTRVTPYEPRS